MAAIEIRHFRESKENLSHKMDRMFSFREYIESNSSCKFRRQFNRKSLVQQHTKSARMIRNVERNGSKTCSLIEILLRASARSDIYTLTKSIKIQKALHNPI